MTLADKISLANAVVVFLTFLALVWYTCETAKLRKAAQAQNKTILLPILMFTSIESRNRVVLALRNVGSGPAFNVTTDPMKVGENVTVTFYHEEKTIAQGEQPIIVRVFAGDGKSNQEWGLLSDLWNGLAVHGGKPGSETTIHYVSVSNRRHATRIKFVVDSKQILFEQAANAQ